MLDKQIGAFALNAVLLHMGMLNPQKERWRGHSICKKIFTVTILI